MAWGKSTTKTLTATTGTITTSTFTAKKFIQMMIHEFGGTGGDWGSIRLNENTNSVYAQRYSRNGGADGTQVSEDQVLLDASDETVDSFYIVYCVSITGEEKILISFHVGFSTAGAGTAPNRTEAVNKFVPSPDAGITQVRYDSDNNTKTMLIDSNLSVLGTD
jgi:hypothetical protein